MTTSNIIHYLFNIKDKNIYFHDDFYNKTINGITYKNIIATVDEHFTHCSNCDSRLIKYGTKKSIIRMLDSNKNQFRIHLRKQKYKCSVCGKIHTSNSKELVDSKCFISNYVKEAVHTTLILDPYRSIKSLSTEFHISQSTIWRILDSYSVSETDRKLSLPEKLCVDEFKSTKSCVSSMSFLYCDGTNHELLGILSSRRGEDIRTYFNCKYSYETRKNVKEISMDLYIPYFNIIKELFPNAKIVFDRFHIVQLVSRSLNSTRIKYMNSIKTKNPVFYRRYKKNWKLFLKAKCDLSMERKSYSRSYKAYISESEIMDNLLKNASNELVETYEKYQEILTALRENDIDVVDEIFTITKDSEVSKSMRKSLRTLRKYKGYVANALITTLNNGIIEGINNIIKLIKRISFGFRNFRHFKTKIYYALLNKTIKVA